MSVVELIKANYQLFLAVGGLAAAVSAIVAVLTFLRAGRSKKQRSEQGLAPMTAADYEREDVRSDWPVYQVAFLWHEVVPPPARRHFELMTRDIEDTKDELHRAAEAGAITITREIQYANGVTRYLQRASLAAYAEAKGVKPKFLFPDARA